MQEVFLACNFQEDIRKEVNSLKSSLSQVSARDKKLESSFGKTTLNVINTCEAEDFSNKIINQETRLIKDMECIKEYFFIFRKWVKGKVSQTSNSTKTFNHFQLITND